MRKRWREEVQRIFVSCKPNGSASSRYCLHHRGASRPPGQSLLLTCPPLGTVGALADPPRPTTRQHVSAALKGNYLLNEEFGKALNSFFLVKNVNIFEFKMKTSSEGNDNPGATVKNMYMDKLGLYIYIHTHTHPTPPHTHILLPSVPLVRKKHINIAIYIIVNNSTPLGWSDSMALHRKRIKLLIE
jgi:hypothetical protein